MGERGGKWGMGTPCPPLSKHRVKVSKLHVVMVVQYTNFMYIRIVYD